MDPAFELYRMRDGSTCGGYDEVVVESAACSGEQSGTEKREQNQAQESWAHTESFTPHKEGENSAVYYMF